MRSFYSAIAICILFFSCQEKKSDAQEVQVAVTTPPPAEKISGETLVARSDCSSCHHLSERVIGPSYQEIAGKYSAQDTDLLADKIINGGQGVWGNVPMTPHSAISKEDARQMVQYILSQKKP